ncbi:MAG: CDP-diacylglycerol--serine O-phosphatidyltransferase, partial [Litorivicinaceae bacterium]|nr:CDP-diacylglycerol--serine O-phosphatidyltransferase [Litorivicinaceae bacterium]
VVAFGVAPAVLVFSWSLSALGKLGWVAAFIYVAGTALRLARFNVQREIVDSNYFVGLACPAAAYFLAAAVWTLVDSNIQGETVALTMVILTAVCGLLMVSSVPYPSFKNSDLKARVPLLAIMAAALIFAFVSLDPPRVLFLLTGFYVLSGPGLWLRTKLGSKRHAAKEEE